jgi:hypothetical protein
MNGVFPLELITGQGWVSTHGLTFLDHPELAMKTPAGADLGEARSVLFSLATHVIAGRLRLQPGDTFALDDRLLRLGAGDYGFLDVACAGRARARCRGSSE